MAVNVAPIQIKTWIQQTSADTSWVECWLRGHNRIAGETESGKTTLAEAAKSDLGFWYPLSIVKCPPLNSPETERRFHSLARTGVN